LEHDVDAEILPRQLSGVLLAEDADGIAIDLESVLRRLDGPVIAAVDGVVAKQMGERLVIGEVVDGDEIEIGVVLPRGAEDVAANASESVDGDAGASLPGSHVLLRSGRVQPRRWKARANVMSRMQHAPAAASVPAHSAAVAPVVRTSSTRMTCIPDASTTAANAPATLARRAAGCKVVWVRLPLVRRS